MPKVIGLDEIQTGSHLQMEIQKGGRFVIYEYCISLLVITFKRFSSVYFLRADESALTRGLPFSLLSFLLGWWGLPWGPIYTIESLWVNTRGGKNITAEVLASMAAPASKPAP